MGKAIMFMVTVFIFTCIGGGIMQGSLGVAGTELAVAIDEDDTTITVDSTTGFPSTGIITIGNEHIAYSKITATTFAGSVVNPVLRGTENTDTEAHSVGELVRTKPGAMMNISTDYYVAVLADSAGLQAFIAKPVAFFQIIGSFFWLPISFMGTDLQILSYIWAIFGIGVLVAIFVALAGGRRV